MNFAASSINLDTVSLATLAKGSMSRRHAPLAALEKLVTCTQRFTKFVLEEDLDAVYSRERDAIYKDFIKCGFKFVKEYVTARNKVEEILESADSKVEQSQLTSDSPKDNHVQNSTTIEKEAETTSSNQKKKKRNKKRTHCPTEPGGQHTSDDISTKEEVCQPDAGEHTASDPPNEAQVRVEDVIHHNAEEKLEVVDTPLSFTKRVGHC
jgi:hypothetical protein